LVALGEKGISTDWFLFGQHDVLLLNQDERGKEQQSDFWADQNEQGKEQQDDLARATNELYDLYSTLSPSFKKDFERSRPGTSVFLETAKHGIPVIVEGDKNGLVIPVISQGASAGFGFDYDEGEIIRYIKVPVWLARKSPDLVALPIYGDSMEPTIGRGDLAVCDGGGFKDDGIYVLRDEDRGLLFCKRVVWDPRGWEIISDNPRYKGKTIPRDSLQIVARVIATVKEVK
jgi:phage repressor protein C with HTH and peptisase S24 domain